MIALNKYLERPELKKDIIRIREGLRKGDYSALYLDNNGSENKIFLARTSMMPAKIQDQQTYLLTLQIQNFPKPAYFRIPGICLDEDLADKTSHDLLAGWAKSKNFLINDDTSYARKD